MSARVNRSGFQPVQAFRPIDDHTDASRSGVRRCFDRVQSLRLLWPEGPRHRFELFDAWHDIAMQIVRQNRIGLHVTSAAKKVMHWSEGAMLGSNEYLASKAGYPSAKTISREISLCVNVGVL